TAAGAFAALAALVAHGDLTPLDEWAMHHAMPEAQFTSAKPTLADALVPLWGSSWHGVVAVTTDLLTLPAALLTSAAVVALACFPVRGWAAVALAPVQSIAAGVHVRSKAPRTRPRLFASAPPTS